MKNTKPAAICRLQLRTVIILFLFLGPAACLHAGQQSDQRIPEVGSTNSKQADENAELAAVAGAVTYKQDAQRSWRYGRFYVHKRKSSDETGTLAEAVVCLTAPGLGKQAFSSQPATITVDQKDLRFVPETTAIRAGDRIKFTNSDPQTHNVHSHSRIHPFDITIAYGDDYVETFERAGGSRVPIVLGCTFHTHMRAWIYIFDHPFFAVTEKDGRFRFENIPPGEYRLEIVHPAGELRTSRKLTIDANSTQTLDVQLSTENRITPRKK